MGFLKRIFRTENVVRLLAPVSGTCISVHNVNDPTFATDILGKGAAIIPSEGKIYAPDNGVITSAFPTGHAIGIKLDSGAEILIHIGIDTVELNGRFFTRHVDVDQTVNKGDLLVEMDLEGVKDSGYDIVTPVIVCNSDEYRSVDLLSGQVTALQDDILMLRSLR